MKPNRNLTMHEKIVNYIRNFFGGEKVHVVYFPVRPEWFLEPITDPQRNKLVQMTGSEYYLSSDCDLNKAEASLLIFYISCDVPMSVITKTMAEYKMYKDRAVELLQKDLRKREDEKE